MCRRTVARAELAGYFRAAPFCILVEARAVEARASARSHPDSFFLPTLRLPPAVLACRSVASCDSAWRARRRPSATQQTWNWVAFCDPATQWPGNSATRRPSWPGEWWPCSIMNSKCRLICRCQQSKKNTRKAFDNDFCCSSSAGLLLSAVRAKDIDRQVRPPRALPQRRQRSAANRAVTSLSNLNRFSKFFHWLIL